LKTVQDAIDALRAGLSVEGDVTARLIDGMTRQVLNRFEYSAANVAVVRLTQQLTSIVRARIAVIIGATTTMARRLPRSPKSAPVTPAAPMDQNASQEQFRCCCTDGQDRLPSSSTCSDR
jgi:hypothetical protein